MRLAFAAVAVLALAAAACGGVENEPNLAQAAERTEGAGSFAIALTERATEDRTSLELECDGAVDTVRSRARIACSVPFSSAGDHEAIVVDESMYLTFSEIAPKWSKMSLEDADAVERLSPQRILGVLRSASDRTERIGDEDVRGEPTVRYALTVECKRAEFVACDGEAVVDVWIDGEGLVRRIRFENNGATVSVEFFGFGIPVDIEPPPADQVTEDGPETGFVESGITTQP